MNINITDLIGKETEHRYLNYTWRDVILYALSVGAKSKDIDLIYEKDLKALPTFGTIPYWATVNVLPKLSYPRPASMYVADVLKPKKSYLNMCHELKLYKQIDPIKGTFQWTDKIKKIYDRGVGKGIAVLTEQIISDEAGRMICSNESVTFFYEGGGFGGEQMPVNKLIIPQSPPTFIAGDYISETQNALYRLTGDTNLVHIDPEFCNSVGFDRPFMQGLCSYGYAVRLAIGLNVGIECSNIKRVFAQMRSILYPNQKVELQLWKISEKRFVFRLMNKSSNEPVLDKGEIDIN